MAESAAHAGAVLTIDLGAIRDNYHLLQSRALRATCGAVLKANAYGLGASRVAPVLAAAGCRHFFVAHLDEGVRLRPHVPASADIYVLHGPPANTEYEFVRHNLTPVLNSTVQVAGWRRAAHTLERPLPAVLQVDSGMSRLGLSKEEVNAAADDADFLRGIKLRYLMSHLACAEEREHPMNQCQLSSFRAIRERFPACPASFANSSGIFLGPDYQFDLMRPGAALYGIAPMSGADNPMKPVVRLQGKIIQLRRIETGDRVGYGVTYRAPSARRLATVSVGYADGWLRAFSNRGAVLVGGVRAPIVGNVSMDTCTIDISDADPSLLYPGATVDLISAEQPLDVVAPLSGTIAYEILTSLGDRYHREYVEAPHLNADVNQNTSVTELSI